MVDIEKIIIIFCTNNKNLEKAKGSFSLKLLPIETQQLISYQLVSTISELGVVEEEEVGKVVEVVEIEDIIFIFILSGDLTSRYLLNNI